MIHMKNMLRKHGCTLKLFGSVTLAQIEEEENLPAENIHRPQRVKTWQDMPPSSTISYQSTGPDAKLDEVFTLPCPNFHSPRKRMPLFLWKKCYLYFLEWSPFGFHHISLHKNHCHQAKGTKHRVQELWSKLLQQTQEEQAHKEIYHPMHRHTDCHSFCPYSVWENFW